ncbi:MAG: hypothetical protein QOG54_2264 [Actinomycetota bacterium]|nr:hypothetical protein [Actinomycetota bacterium]
MSGSPLGDPDQEISKLNEIQTTMLTKWLTNGVLKWGEDDFTPSEVTAAFKDLEMRGLARRTNRGSVLTGRGLILHERLAMRAGEAIGGYAKPRAPEEKD